MLPPMPIKAVELRRLYRRIAEHREITTAIAARAPGTARAAMRRHMDRTCRRDFKD